MSTPAVSPLFMKNALVKLTFTGDSLVDFACHVRSVAVVPNPGKIVTYTPLCPDAAYSDQEADTFTLEMSGVQSWDAVGLARKLWEKAGTDVVFRIEAYGVAVTTSKPAMTGTAKVVRPTYGGEAGSWAEFDVVMPISVTPTIAIV